MACAVVNIARIGLLTGIVVASPFTLGSASAWNPLLRELDGLRQEHNVPAMGLVLLVDGAPVVLQGFGSATVDTPFRWGSISKTFTAVGALLLAATTGTPLNTPIRPLLGEGYYVNAWADSEPVRLIQLLELTAGLTDLSGVEFDDNRPLPLWEALRRNADKRATIWPPGLQHSYTNAAPGLTAAVMERISGQTFEHYMREAVLQPAGMPRAGFDPLEGLPGGFRIDGRTEIPYWHMTFRAFGALNASTSDMANFLTLLLNDGRGPEGRVFPAGLLDSLYTPVSSLGAQRGLRVGYGTGAYGWVRSGHLFWGHGGDADGYQSRYGLLRGPERGYAVIINTDNPRLLRRMQRLIETALVADLPAAAPPAAVDDPDLHRYVGTYYPASTRFRVARWRRGEGQVARVRREGSTLVFSRDAEDAQGVRLTPLGDGRFRRAADPKATVIFATDTDGTLFLQGELGNFLHSGQGSCPEFIARCR